MLCAFVFLPGLGVGGTIRLACAIGLGVCLLSLLLDRRDIRLPEAAETARVFRRREPDGAARWTRLELAVLLGYGLSGAAALIYEVAWTRVLSLVLGSSVYAFSLMLAAFILGLALGSAIVGRFVDRLRDTISGFALAELGIALTVLAAVPLFGQLPVAVVRMVQGFSGSFAALQAAEFGLVVAIMIVPTLLMGAAFVLVSRACVSITGKVGRTIGVVYAANTVGAVIGAFSATFVWIPWIGTQHTILLASAVNGVIGVLLLVPILRPVPWRLSVAGLAAGACLAAAAIGLPDWDQAIMSCGAFLYADRYALDNSATAADIRGNMRSMPVLYYREDIGGTVTVRDDGCGDRILFVGGKADATRAGDLTTQLLLAHVPLLLHPQPRQVLMIGLASGISLGAVATHDLAGIDCVEISPAMVEASHYFDDDNGRPLSDPRVRLIVGDGRNHVSLTDRTYDVIISEPSNPWMAGVADLFTLEYFEACRSRLNPGGLACVWMQAYDMDDAIFRSIVRTFGQAFPHMLIVEVSPGGDYLLIGSGDPIRTPYTSLASRIGQPAIAGNLARIDIHHPLDLLQRIVLSSRMDEFAGSAPVHSDDSVLVEFAAPRTLYDSSGARRVMADLYRLRQPDLGMLAFEAGQDVEQAQIQADLARRLQVRAMADEALRLWTEDQYEKAIGLARKAFGLEPAACDLVLAHGKGMLLQARAAQTMGDRRGALRLTARAAALVPHLTAAYVQLADLLAQNGKWDEAVHCLRSVLARQADDQAVLNDLAWVLASAPEGFVRNGPEAVALAERLCQLARARNPFHLRTLAAAYAEVGRFQEAAETAAAAAELAAGSDPALAARIREQAALYRQGQPYRQP